MIVAGGGITPFNAKVKPDFRPMTELALSWRQLSSGNWRATDRGTDADRYGADIRLYGTETNINQFLTELEVNRASGSHVLLLSGFNATEHIFGADVDHSVQISATVTELGRRAQRTWKGFGVSLKLVAHSPAFVGTPSLPVFRCLQWGYKGAASFSVNKIESYKGAFTYTDRGADVGLFEGEFEMTDAEMRDFRRYIAGIRGATISISAIDGVDNPFGPRRASGYPYQAKIVRWTDMGMRDVNNWTVQLTLAEEA